MKKKFLSLLLALVFVSVLVIPAYAVGEPQATEHIVDFAGLLSEEELYSIEELAMQADDYGCGIYIITCNDYTTEIGGSDIDEACMNIYTELDLGLGEERDGLILLLSMAERDWAFYSHGHLGNAVKSQRVYDYIVEGMLSYLGDDEWYNGLYYFAEQGLYNVQLVDQWRQENPDLPVNEYEPEVSGGYTFGGVAICIGLGLVLAFVVVGVLKRQLKSVYTGSEADNYIQGGLNLSSKYDTYTHTTETRTYSPQKSDNNSNSSSGGGFSGGSGKF